VKSDRLPGLQIARAVAALSVMYFHSWTVLDRFPKGTAYPIPVLSEFGGLGVDLFFAISGFVTCLVVSRRQFHISSFFVKRVFRLYPLWLLTLTAFAALAMLWRNPTETETIGYFFYSATLLPTENFPFYNIGWSLQHEMAFYALTVLIVPLFRLHGLAGFLLLSNIAFHTVEMPWYFSNLSMYHAEFLAGVLAFIARRKLSVLGPILPLVLGAASLACIAWLARPLWIPGSLFLLILGFANVEHHQSSWLAIPVGLGDASYSIYLIHPLVFVMVKAVTTSLPKDVLWIEEPLRFGSIAIVLALSLASWRYIEHPIILLGNYAAGQLKNQPVTPNTDHYSLATDSLKRGSRPES
jgi:exopolysaccharide production protein ExoZ